MKNKIVSMSLHDEILEEIDSLTKELGFKGRSETIRAGIKSLVQEKEERRKLSGKINAVLSLVHDHAKGIAKSSHDFQEVISSHLHNHLESGKCLEIFVLKGDAKKIRGMVENFQKNKNIERVKLTVC